MSREVPRYREADGYMTPADGRLGPDGKRDPEWVRAEDHDAALAAADGVVRGEPERVSVDAVAAIVEAARPADGVVAGGGAAPAGESDDDVMFSAHPYTREEWEAAQLAVRNRRPLPTDPVPLVVPAGEAVNPYRGKLKDHVGEPRVLLSPRREPTTYAEICAAAAAWDEGYQAAAGVAGELAAALDEAMGNMDSGYSDTVAIHKRCREVLARFRAGGGDG